MNHKIHLKQREILNDIAPDFERDGQTGFIRKKRDAITSFISEYVDRSGADGIVLGLSGGVDSFIVGALCALSCADSKKRLLLVSQPNCEQEDYEDVLDCARAISGIYGGAEFITVSIEHGYEGVLSDLRSAESVFDGGRYVKGNIQARLRMVCQYALAQRLLVAGTDHATEAVTGFYTKYGDGGTDVNPIAELIKDDIYLLSGDLGAPKAVMEKAPSAGLGISETDEEELGIAYRDICAYLRGNVIDGGAREKLEGYYEASRHKRAMPATMKDIPVVAGGRTIVFVEDGNGGQKPADSFADAIAYINSRPHANVLYLKERPDAAFNESLYTGIKKTVNTPIERYNVFIGDGRTAANAVNGAYGKLSDNISGGVRIVGANTFVRAVDELRKIGVKVNF